MRILYLIQTPWNWILQRSQVFELGLEENHVCTVLDRHYLPFGAEKMNNARPQDLRQVIQFRGSGKVKLVSKINDHLYHLAVKRLIPQYEAVWLCYPTFIKYIPKSYGGLVVYDCMDNHVAMAPNAIKNEVYEEEQKLINRAGIIFASSKRLIETIPGMGKAVLIRNGFISKTTVSIKSAHVKRNYTIGYFGAIETWFDFEKIIHSTDAIAEIQYRLIGPNKLAKFSKDRNDIRKFWETKRIYLEGVVEHAELEEKISDYDALIMPFIVNDIILSVDPVKLYEYICYGKCVISVWYPEIERFSPYVYFYHDEHEFLELLNDLVVNGFRPKYCIDEQIEFLKNNTWEKRCEAITKVLEEKFS